MPDKSFDPSANEWLRTACEILEIDYEEFRPLVSDLLDLTRDVAHGPSRPAAPLTAFLAGVAAGRDGGELTETARTRIAALTERLQADAEAN